MGRARVESAKTRKFWAFGSGYNEGALIDEAPEGTTLGYDFYKGESLAGTYPQGVTVSFSKGFRKEIKVFDSVANSFSLPIVSGRIKAILERLAPGQCELIPIVILNHKRKVASDDHSLLNTLRIADFIDMKRSRYELSALKPDQIGWLQELHLRPEKVDPDVHIFRAKTLLTQVFIDEVIHQAFEEEKITGLRLFPAEGWDGDTM